MSGLFGTMNSGIRGLMASQLALSVTSQNISNANTEGYSRKRLNLSADYRQDPAFGQMGFGVTVTNITRVRDFFLDQQINRQTQEFNYFNEMNDTMTRLENIYGEPSDSSLATTLDQFWSAWSDLANNPQSTAARDVLVANAQVLTDTMHNLSKEMRNLRESKNNDIETTVTQINEYLKEIFSLNKEISSVELSGKAIANDSRDQRDLAIKKLSQLINITTEDAGNGTVAVLTNGNMLVAPSSYVTLETNTVTLKRPDGSTYSDVGVRFSSTKQTYMPLSGKLRGVFDSRDDVIPYFEDKLDEIANSIVNKVNDIHRTGYTLNGTTGLDFFKVNSHTEFVQKHREVVSNHSFAFNPLALPFTRNLGTPDIVSGSFVLTDANGGGPYTEGVDYSINYSTGEITMLGGALASPPMPAPPLTPELIASYEYDVPQGDITVFETYASNIEIAASILQNSTNIAAASGTTVQSFADTLVIGAAGVYQYIHHTPGPDGTYSTPDDDPDGIPGTGDELRERATIKDKSVVVRSGATVLSEGTDYYIDYPNGRILLLNAAYAGSPLNVEYKAAVPGSNGVSDNAIAVQISELRHQKIMVEDYSGEPTATMNTFYNSFISELGVQKNEFTANSDSRQFLLEQFEARQSEVAGVSLDEELANLVKYQHTYQASARVVSTVDKMLEVLFSM
ncbi:MAG: flagellar hook-associated protein FlgK [Fibrobacteres bacterium]|nr:flagellar hook-associated protein FlgK [Fibrobacterota bacterium]